MIFLALIIKSYGLSYDLLNDVNQSDSKLKQAI